MATIAQIKRELEWVYIESYRCPTEKDLTAEEIAAIDKKLDTMTIPVFGGH